MKIILGLLIALLSFSQMTILGMWQLKTNLKAKPQKPIAEIEQQQKRDREFILLFLPTLAKELEDESDKPASTIQRARIADLLWKDNEFEARAIFQRAFDSIRLPVAEWGADYRNLTRDRQLVWLQRQASAIKEILRLLSLHDQKAADVFLKKLEEQKKENQPLDPSSEGYAASRMELLAQVAVEIAPTNPEQGFKLGVQSLSGPGIPDALGRLLFALASEEKRLSDKLALVVLQTLKRNRTTYSSILLVLTNYLFNPQGELLPGADPVLAGDFINFIADLTAVQANLWTDNPTATAKILPDDTAQLYIFLVSRVVSIIRANAGGDRFLTFQTLLAQLSNGLTQEHQQQLSALTTLPSEPIEVSELNTNANTDRQVEEALKEKDPGIRDAHLRGIAINLMRENIDTAFAVAWKISDKDVRVATEDDLNLFVVTKQLKSRSYQKARDAAFRLSRSAWQARLLAEIAANEFSKSYDTQPQAPQYFYDAYHLALKGDDTAEKVEALLVISELVSRVDLTCSFNALSAAVTTANRVRTEEKSASLVAKKPTVTVESIVVVNGKEIRANQLVTMDSINFEQAGALGLQDFTRTRLIGMDLENRLLRIKYMIAMSRSILADSENKSKVTEKSTMK